MQMNTLLCAKDLSHHWVAQALELLLSTTAGWTLSELVFSKIFALKHLRFQEILPLDSWIFEHMYFFANIYGANIWGNSMSQKDQTVDWASRYAKILWQKIGIEVMLELDVAIMYISSITKKTIIFVSTTFYITGNAPSEVNSTKKEDVLVLDLPLSPKPWSPYLHQYLG